MAIAEGADLLGGIDPLTMDGDLDGQLDTLFAIASRRGVGLDVHLHDPRPQGLIEIAALAERAKAYGMEGQATVLEITPVKWPVSFICHSDSEHPLGTRQSPARLLEGDQHLMLLESFFDVGSGLNKMYNKCILNAEQDIHASDGIPDADREVVP